MSEMSWLLAALFVPLFPLSMIFNIVLQRIHNTWLRAVLILVWPLPGVWLLHTLSVSVPAWIIPWALFSAGLYGFRAIVVRECGVWSGFLATSAWSLCWIVLAVGVKANALLLYVLAFSVPLALLMILIGELERRYESAYAGIVCGLTQAQPRLAGILVITVLAVIGSPLFPSFFAMLGNITSTITIQPGAIFGMVLVWLLWSWSAMKLLQELLVGSATINRHNDINYGSTMMYTLALIALIIAGLYLSGRML